MADEVRDIETIDLPAANAPEMEALLKTVEDLEGDIDRLEEELSKVKSEASAEKQELLSKLSVKEAENKELSNECEALKKKVQELSESEKRALAERIADIKVRRGKINASAREEAVNELMGRSVESLKDTLKDLLSEEPAVELPSESPDVQTLAVPGEKNAPIEGIDDQKPKMSLEDMLMWLFSGKKRRR